MDWRFLTVGLGIGATARGGKPSELERVKWIKMRMHGPRRGTPGFDRQDRKTHADRRASLYGGTASISLLHCGPGAAVPFSMRYPP